VVVSLLIGARTEELRALTSNDQNLWMIFGLVT
jgi:hypothetical protein